MVAGLDPSRTSFTSTCAPAGLVTTESVPVPGGAPAGSGAGVVAGEVGAAVAACVAGPEYAGTVVVKGIVSIGIASDAAEPVTSIFFVITVSGEVGLLHALNTSCRMRKLPPFLMINIGSFSVLSLKSRGMPASHSV